MRTSAADRSRSGISTSAGSCGSCRRCSSCSWSPAFLAYVYCLPVELKEYSKEPRQRGRFGFQRLFRGDCGLFRCAGRNQAAAAYLVAGRRGAVLPDRAAVDAVCLSVCSEAGQSCCLRCRRRPVVRGGYGSSAIETRLSCSTSRRFAPGSWRSARCCRSGSFRRPPRRMLEKHLRRRRDCCCCSASSCSDRRRRRCC